MFAVNARSGCVIVETFEEAAGQDADIDEGSFSDLGRDRRTTVFAAIAVGLLLLAAYALAASCRRAQETPPAQVRRGDVLSMRWLFSPAWGFIGRSYTGGWLWPSALAALVAVAAATARRPAASVPPPGPARSRLRRLLQRISLSAALGCAALWAVGAMAERTLPNLVDPGLDRERRTPQQPHRAARHGRDAVPSRRSTGHTGAEASGCPVQRESPHDAGARVASTRRLRSPTLPTGSTTETTRACWLGIAPPKKRESSRPPPRSSLTILQRASDLIEQAEDVQPDHEIRIHLLAGKRGRAHTSRDRGPRPISRARCGRRRQRLRALVDRLRLSGRGSGPECRNAPSRRALHEDAGHRVSSASGVARLGRAAQGAARGLGR